ncbi:MAG: CaiB/BaiF CoA transferase family protein [Alphaproteobacteria bacterium]
MKLDGVKVLDLSAFLPGPHMTMTMADHGADVVMVEPANGTGEPTRQIGYRTADGVSVWFRNIARGKRSLKIDLKNEQGHALFLALARAADVVVESFRPGVVRRLGVDYDTLRRENPRLIYCSISAFGQYGPYRDRPAHDLAVQGLAGTAALGLGLEDGKPSAPNMPAADMAASLTALSAILMALYRREKTRQGEYIDISMYDALLAWTPNVTGPVFAQNRAPEPKTMRSFGGAAMNRIYETADGEFIILGGSEVKFAANLLNALGRPDLLDLAKEEPGPVQNPLIDFLRETFRSKPRAHWEAFLEPLDVCWAPVRDLKAAFDDPHTIERGMRLTDEQGNAHIGAPVKFRHEPASPDLTLARYGQHSEELARKAGFPADRLQALKDRGGI